MGGQICEPQDCERTECLVGHGKASHLHNILSQPATCRATAVINAKRDTDVLEGRGGIGIKRLDVPTAIATSAAQPQIAAREGTSA